MAPLPVVRRDGGRAAAGYKGAASDCACRAIAIATESDYQMVYDMIIRFAAKYERPSARKRPSHPRTGVHRALMMKIMSTRGFGWNWHPTMGIGTGCKVHLAEGELPSGRLITSVSRHYVAVINGIVFDSHDPTRGGTRCVYGYWTRD
jgi:hypothetical protein